MSKLMFMKYKVKLIYAEGWIITTHCNKIRIVRFCHYGKIVEELIE